MLPVEDLPDARLGGLPAGPGEIALRFGRVGPCTADFILRVYIESRMASRIRYWQNARLPAQGSLESSSLMDISNQGPIRILIVDDHAVLRKAVRGLLESRSEFEVCGEAEDGPQAIELAGELKPDVVILDIVMPKMNGFEVARKMRGVSPHSQIVILSSHKDNQLLEEARNVGAVCYVPKADAERELIDAVKAAARGGSSAAP